MCHKVKCTECNKWTWAGCGQHIEEALKGIPKKNRCKCPRTCVIS
jgi:hypothetical protein